MPFSLYLSLNSSYATVYNKQNERTEYRLHANPFLYEGRTMVPLRFIAEALGADVEWNGEVQSITIINKDTTIILWINKKQAYVNGRLYELDVPPMIKDQYTMVPLRFISENFNMKVYFNSGMILITDTENEYFENYDNSASIVEEPETTANDTSVFYGKWSLWVPGAFVADLPIYVHGAQAGWIEVSANGTYKWMDLGKVYEGNWYDSGTKGQIIIQNGPLDSNWTMRMETGDSVKIYAWGLEYKGSRVID